MPQPKPRLMAAALLLAFAALVLPVAAQETPKPLMLVTWFGPGAIVLPSGQDWKPELVTVYDKGTRPVAQFNKASAGLTASFIIFENHSGNPTAQGCQEDVINPLIHNNKSSIAKRVDGEAKAADGSTVATTSYLVDLNLAGTHHAQHHLFGFAGDAKTCAEIHISTVRESQADLDVLQSTLSDFHPKLSYKPTAIDYFHIASILFKNAPELAAPYYKSSLDALPQDAASLNTRRLITDQLVMSLGMSGDLKNSRAVAEQAIKADPDYPMNYYNLACADAEQGNASNAKVHLQQAFDRRANVLKGESLPDPAKDDSILKLKKDKAFWAFVESLPKN